MGKGGIIVWWKKIILFVHANLPVGAKRTCPPVLWRRSRYRGPVECISLFIPLGPALSLILGTIVNGPR